jgi:hypothetical protein
MRGKLLVCEIDQLVIAVMSSFEVLILKWIF